jgi:ATP-dependent Clp protease adaptor protein ClpS
MADTEQPSVGTAEPKKKPRKQPKRAAKPGPPRQLPPYNVVLVNDDDHTYQYVIEMLKAVFAHPAERGMQLAEEVDSRGRAIVMTTHKERAEFKRDQVHAFGADRRVAACKGSMTAFIEPASDEK